MIRGRGGVLVIRSRGRGSFRVSSSYRAVLFLRMVAGIAAAHDGSRKSSSLYGGSIMFTIANLLKLFLFCKVQLGNEHNEDRICVVRV